MRTRFNGDLEKMINFSALFSCLVFFIAHIAYIIFFACINVKPLLLINIASSCFYIIMFLLIKFKLYTIYVYSTIIEIAVYMTLGTLFFGNSAGFHLCLFGLSTLSFFAGFFSKFGKRRIKPILFSVVLMADYIFLYIWRYDHAPFRDIALLYERILYVSHVIVVFGVSIIFLAMLTDYTVNLEKKMWKESETDKLTNISNRKGLATYYISIGDQKANYIIAIFDIDNFKSFNDLNGHQCGDYVLKEVARIALQNSKDDFVSRWGGEEFVIISKKDESLEDTYNKIDRIRKEIEKFDFVYKDKPLKTTITIGVAEYEGDNSLEEWITRADEKLYYGKQHGKNQMVK